jgi:aromatic-L-amino-acid decarboxylase
VDADVATMTLLERLNDGGEVFLTHTNVAGRAVLRIAIGSPATTPAHVERVWALLRENYDFLAADFAAAARERAEAERAAREQAERERAERAEQERAERERVEQEQAERERVEQEQAQAEQAPEASADAWDVGTAQPADATTGTTDAATVDLGAAGQRG